MREGDGDVSRGLLAIKFQGKTDLQMFYAHSLYRHKGWWIQLLDPFLAVGSHFSEIPDLQ